MVQLTAQLGLRHQRFSVLMSLNCLESNKVVGILSAWDAFKDVRSETANSDVVMKGGEAG